MPKLYEDLHDFHVTDVCKCKVRDSAEQSFLCASRGGSGEVRPRRPPDPTWRGESASGGSRVLNERALLITLMHFLNVDIFLRFI